MPRASIAGIKVTADWWATDGPFHPGLNPGATRQVRRVRPDRSGQGGAVDEEVGPVHVGRLVRGHVGDGGGDPLGEPNGPRGVTRPSSLMSAPSGRWKAAVIGVSMAPGLMLLTRRPWAAYSTASARVRASTPPLDAT